MSSKLGRKRSQQKEKDQPVPTKLLHHSTGKVSTGNDQLSCTYGSTDTSHSASASRSVNISKPLLVSSCSNALGTSPATFSSSSLGTGAPSTDSPSPASVSTTTADQKNTAENVSCTSKAAECNHEKTTASSTNVDSTAKSVRLDRKFYDIPADNLAKLLLGQVVVRMVDGVRIAGKIVETEAYLGPIDKAAHSYRRKTDRNKAMFMEPGTAYVYNIYGMYCCLNISSKGEGCAVLIRSVQPVEGVEKMTDLRRGKMKSSSPTKPLKDRDLGNGPSKLCQALAITKEAVNQQDLVTSRDTWLERGEPVAEDSIVVSARINIGYAEDWTDKPLRFYVLANPFVSVRDKKAEKEMESTSQYF